LLIYWTLKNLAKLIDGKIIANNIIQNIALKTEKLSSRKPCLAVIQVGNDPASSSYIKQKELASIRAGFDFRHITLPINITEHELLTTIEKCCNDNALDSLLVQLPLPKHICPNKIVCRIKSDKDADGFHPHNMGCLFYGINISGMHAVIVGASNIVGKPLIPLLLAKNTTVTVCHKFTKNLHKHVAMADILISATGNTNAIKANNIKENAIIIDVGINFVDGKLVGDLDQEIVKQKASWYTPVPGGVGPMTVAMLIENTWKSYINTFSQSAI
jgi:methylenetetrahydrofolate dehydrogenase (NADP+)/methenyltetrahydrofolate cyclohydrolase